MYWYLANYAHYQTDHQILNRPENISIMIFIMVRAVKVSTFTRRTSLISIAKTQNILLTPVAYGILTLLFP